MQQFLRACGGMTRCASVAVAIIVMLHLAPISMGGVVVQQVEAFEDQSPDTSPPFFRYAPVDFAGSATVSDDGQFPGVTFHAQDTFGDALHATSASHARVVGDNFYGNDSVGRAHVRDVYSNSVENFITQAIRTEAGPSTAGVRPGFFGNGVRVSNHSWVSSYSPDFPSADENAIRRLDYMSDREDVVIVAAAATLGGTGTPLVWS
ncbi:MAG: hypothetical protein ACREIT_02355, partial [Tepidisphaeraceae bacterium]